MHGWPLSGGALTELAGLQESPSRIVADASAVYFAQRVCSKLIKMPHGGGALSLLGEVSGSLVGLGIDATHVYVGTQTGEIAKFPK